MLQMIQTNQSTVQQLYANQQNFSECSLHQEEKVLFQCKQPVTCPFYKVQRFYCLKCATPIRHNHVPETIILKSKELSDKWMSLKQRVSTIKNTVETLKQDNQDLIDLFETPLNENEKLLSISIADFTQFAQEVEEYFQLHIQEAIAKSNVLALQDNEQIRRIFTAKLENKDLFKDGTLLVFWHFYSNLIDKINVRKSHSTLCFASFKLFLSLKLKSIDEFIQPLSKKQAGIIDYNNLDENYFRLNEEIEWLIEGQENISSTIFKLKSSIDFIGMALMLLDDKKQDPKFMNLVQNQQILGAFHPQNIYNQNWQAQQKQQLNKQYGYNFQQY